MIELTFIAQTKPQPQGSIKSFIIEGRLNIHAPCDRSGKPNWERKPKVVSTSDNDELSYFRDFVGYEARWAVNRRGYDVPFARHHEPVELVVEFVFERPKTVGAGRDMVVRPDIDKLQRALFDGLTGILYVDDSQIVAVSVRKLYGKREEVRVRAAVIREAELFDALPHQAIREPKNTNAPARSGAGANRVSRTSVGPRPTVPLSDRKRRLARMPA